MSLFCVRLFRHRDRHRWRLFRHRHRSVSHVSRKSVPKFVIHVRQAKKCETHKTFMPYVFARVSQCLTKFYLNSVMRFFARVWRGGICCAVALYYSFLLFYFSFETLRHSRKKAIVTQFSCVSIFVSLCLVSHETRDTQAAQTAKKSPALGGVLLSVHASKSSVTPSGSMI